ncbi:UDP-glycosyltransferase UGT5-like [Episyrphus balteatus]|uniref:UDP-glycosyltransferase UGT5-like n=1 Tax=Episyrphus balteatus TaxID=286459 RepID=UPI0024867BF5|nr:UDP-glycosyltransferase UGT5-like [Episyrphus balteatus]
MNIRKYLCFSLVLLLTISYSNAGRILAAFVFPGKSHFMMHKTLIRELVNRGHEVTFITSDSMGKNMGPNYTEVLVPVYDFWFDVQSHFKTDNLFELTSMTLDGFLKMLEIIGTKTTEHALLQPGVQEIFNRTDTENVYDVLLAEQFYQEAFLTLGLKYNIPVILSSTLGYESYMSQMMGYISPWSFVPHGFLPFDDKMSFWERVSNSFASMYQDLHREFVYFPKQDALIQKYLSHLPMKIPKVTEMEKNISVMLLNSYVPLATPRPTVPGMIPIGGVHIYPPKTLPDDIKKFLDGATDGAIYFSLGSNVRSADMPPEKLKIFLQVFGSMKQRILWKFETDETAEMPKNVMVHKWMPQSDILAHPNVKVFITHGGLFGSQEGVHYAVPMLGMPFYCDQHLNMNKATKAGYAITLKFQEITADILKTSLMELIENPSYKENIQRISNIFRDRPLCPRETAMYWIEYVIRHRGARQIRSAGLDLAWYQFYLLDVIGFVLFIVSIMCGITFVALRKLFKRQNVKEKTN